MKLTRKDFKKLSIESNMTRLLTQDVFEQHENSVTLDPAQVIVNMYYMISSQSYNTKRRHKELFRKFLDSFLNEYDNIFDD